MLLADSVKNAIIDRLTGRSTSAGPIMALGDASGGIEARFYTGAQDPLNDIVQPVNAYFATANTPSWAAASNGACPLTAAATVTDNVAGTLTFFRWSPVNNDVAANHLADLSVGLAGSGKEIILNSVTADGSGTMTCTDFTFRMAESSGDTKLSTDLRNAILNNLVRSGAAPELCNGGTLEIYSGTAPASADVAPTGTLLWTKTLASTDWNTASTGSAALAASLSANAVATGTAGYARITNGTFVIQGSVGTSGTTFVVSTTSLVNGVSASVTEATISVSV